MFYRYRFTYRGVVKVATTDALTGMLEQEGSSQLAHLLAFLSPVLGSGTVPTFTVG